MDNENIYNNDNAKIVGYRGWNRPARFLKCFMITHTMTKVDNEYGDEAASSISYASKKDAIKAFNRIKEYIKGLNTKNPVANPKITINDVVSIEVDSDNTFKFLSCDGYEETIELAEVNSSIRIGFEEGDINELTLI